MTELSAAFDRPHAATETRFVTSDGVSLAVFEQDPADAVTTVILLHGWTLDHRTWDDVTPLLAARHRDLRVLSYDHRGHGRSDPAPVGTTTLERLADDLAELIEDRVPTGRIVLVGHSLGGMTLMALAERHPAVVADRVGGAAFVATSAGHRRPDGVQTSWLEERFSQLMALLERPLRKPWLRWAARCNTRWSLFGRDARLRDVDRMIEQSSLAAPGAVTGFQAALARHSRHAALRHYRDIPTIVFGGGRDRLCPVRDSRAIAAELSGDLVLYPRAGHILPYERARDVARRLNELIISAGR
ncbi:alpha/beta fold hydrolase [Nocardia iowensis]|uniref:Alpha/beta hydrolase n=1 Tax=Nocardia iowensis TaxID=204891 RepID=A0ABX8RFN3_NOCIO|nr:alpha/beta hydrolase [Nocardia iowensis]QXN88417.1 alpha/beta hydrolase [Nocardia iowensis]